jgi:monovalent cation:H+ antiporter-2, CPA2 family
VFYHHDRDALRQLAELWDPNLPAEQNTAYIKRARELNKELEVQLLARMEQDRPAEAG